MLNNQPLSANFGFACGCIHSQSKTSQVVRKAKNVLASFQNTFNVRRNDACDCSVITNSTPHHKFSGHHPPNTSIYMSRLPSLRFAGEADREAEVQGPLRGGPREAEQQCGTGGADAGGADGPETQADPNGKPHSQKVLRGNMHSKFAWRKRSPNLGRIYNCVPKFLKARDEV